MDKNSLTFITLFLWIILAETVIAEKETPSINIEVNYEEEMVRCAEDEGSGGYEVETSGDGEELLKREKLELAHPSLSCMIFKQTGCSKECLVIGQAFSLPTRGSCDDDEMCKCDVIRSISSVDTLWNDKFGSLRILHEIKGNKKLLGKVRVILARASFMTARETKAKLKSILPEDMYNKIILEDYTDAAKMIKRNGQLNPSAVKKHVSGILSKTLSSQDITNLYNSRYKLAFFNAIKKAKAESEDKFLNLYVYVRRTKNKSLNSILNQYMKITGTKEPPRDKEPIKYPKPATVAETIADSVIDKLINLVDHQNSTRSRKPPGRRQIIKETGEECTNEDDESTSDASTDDTSLDENRFKLSNLNKRIFRKSGPINKKLSRNGYVLSYIRDWATNVYLNWAKGTDKVVIEKLASTQVRQSWTFGNVRITLSKAPNGDIKQDWNFGTSRYKYSRDPAGYVDFDWSEGKADKKMLAKYQKFIDAWCRDNYFLIDKMYCVIYEVGSGIHDILAVDHLLPARVFEL